eukprot:Opistho-1_new@24039
MERKSSKGTAPTLTRDGSNAALMPQSQGQPENIRVKLDVFRKYRAQQEELLKREQETLSKLEEGILFDGAGVSMEGCMKNIEDFQKKIQKFDEEIQNATRKLDSMGLMDDESDEEDASSDDGETPIEKMMSPVIVNEATVEAANAVIAKAPLSDSLHLWNIASPDNMEPILTGKHTSTLKFLHINLSPSVHVPLLDLSILGTLAITGCGLIDSDFAPGMWLGDLAPLVNLRRLYLGQNHLTVIPAPVFALEGLFVLSLPQNKIAEISPQLERLRRLRYLALDHNKLERLDPSILTLKHLRGFSASHNEIAVAPVELKQLQNLVHVMNFEGNGFLSGGELPRTASIVSSDASKRSTRHLTLTPVMVRANRKSTSGLLKKLESQSSNAGTEQGPPSPGQLAPLDGGARPLRRSSSAGPTVILPVRDKVEGEQAAA